MLAIRLRDTGEEIMKKRSVEPSLDRLGAVSEFFEAELAACQAPPKVIAQVNVAIDEIFSNIARYSGATSATVCPGSAVKETWERAGTSEPS